MATDTKQQVQDVLEQLPDDCSIEDVQAKLYVIQKVRAGLTAVDEGHGLTHEQAAGQLQKWITK
jgi:predicted transcriptional regulator